MKKNIVFYNAYHKGDLHYSRQFMKDIQKNLSTKYEGFFYSDKYPDDNIYFDLVDFKRLPFKNMLNENSQVTYDEKNVYINTWIGQGGYKYVVESKCSLKSYHNMYKDIYVTLGIPLKRIDAYIPTIDYTKLDQQHTVNILNFNSQQKLTNVKKKILICNGDVLSFQSENFKFEYIVNILAFMNLNCTFICTSKSFLPKTDNVVFCEDIIKKDGCDLNEISFLSTFCDIIVGRASGPYAFTHVKENIGNKDIDYISLCKNIEEGIWYQGKASNSWSDKYTINNIVDMINLKIND
jgi:hypothetical protein